MHSQNGTFQIKKLMFPIENEDVLQKLNEALSLDGQVKAMRLQDKLGEQSFHEDMEKTFEPVTKSNKSVSEGVRKTMIQITINNNKAIENLK